MAEDPDRKILDWCGHLAVPRLVDDKAYSNCRGCQAKMGGLFGSNKSHHCRLCGHMYCSSCTAKYHVPLIFRIKNKDGPTRVCMSCVNDCMAEKAAAAAPAVAAPVFGASALSSSHVSASLQAMAGRINELAPPDEWEDETLFQQCPKCSVKKGKTHNCRVCGICFCSNCTSKMDLPPYFEKKKGKTGPTRVCDSCRFKIVSGAKLVERLTNPPVAKKAPPPPPPAGFLGARRPSMNLANRCAFTGCMQPALTGLGSPEARCSTHAASVESQPVQAVVKREGSDAIVARLHIPSGEANLATIDVLLKKTAPQTEAYQFVFRGEPVPEAFHPVFLARHLGPTLFIRPKRSAGLVMDEPQIGALSGVQTLNNPFKSDPELERKRQAAKDLQEQRAKAKPATAFRKVEPKVLRVAQVTHATRQTQPPPPPVSATPSTPSAALALASGASIDSICRERAKKIFGQL